MSRPAPAVRSPSAVIFGTVFLDLVGFGIVIPVLPLYAERYGASPLVVGLLLGLYSAMQFVCAPILGRISDRVGRRPVLLISVIGTSIGFLLMGLANSLWLLFAARIIDGITGGNISTAQAYIADITPPEQRSRGMGLLGAAFGLGFIFGPAIGGLLSHVSLAAPFYFAACLAAANAAAIYCFLPESLPEAQRGVVRKQLSFLEVLRRAGEHRLGIILATYFCTTVGFSLLTATYALFTERRYGFTAGQIGYIFAGLGLLGAVIQGGLLGALVKWFGDKKLVVAGSLLLTAGLFALPFGSTVGWVLLATTTIAIGHSLTLAPLNGLASKSADSASQGEVLGVMQSAASVARIVGPVLGGWLLNVDVIQMADLLGRAPFAAAAAVTLVAALLALAL